MINLLVLLGTLFYVIQLILVFGVLADDIKYKRKKFFPSIWHVLIFLIPMYLYIGLVVMIICIPLEHFGIIGAEKNERS